MPGFSFAARHHGGDGHAEAAKRDADDAGQTVQRLIDFAGLAPSEPGVGAGEEDHGEHFFFGDGEGIELEAEDAVGEADDVGGQLGIAGAEREDDGEGIAVVGVHAFEQLHGEAAAGDVDGLAGNDAAVAERDADGRGEIDAHMLASLAGFAGDGDADAEDDDVEGGPEGVGDDGAGVGAVPQPAEAGDVQEAGMTISRPSALKASSTMKGWAMRASKKVCVTMPPLLVTLNLPGFGIEERDERGQQDVGREDGLVDLVPEGMAVVALDAAVGDAGEREVRQRVGEDGDPVAGNVGEAEDEVDERRGEEDEARQRVEEVRHRVEVAEALRPG